MCCCNRKRVKRDIPDGDSVLNFEHNYRNVRIVLFPHSDTSSFPMLLTRKL
jgi:hypothetical protein